jgi:transposase
VQGDRLGALKNDKADAAILAQLLRADLLPEAWIAPQQVRALRALLRHRIQLVRLRTLLGNRIHAIAADHGHDRPAGYWSGPGRAWLACLDLPPASRRVIEDDLALIGSARRGAHVQAAELANRDWACGLRDGPEALDDATGSSIASSHRPRTPPFCKASTNKDR